MPIVPELSVEVAAALPRGQGLRREDAVTSAVAASLIVHALILGVASIWQSPPVQAPEINVSVELLSLEQYEAETGGDDTVASPAIPAKLPISPEMARTEERDSRADGMVRPARMLSAAALVDPKSTQAREMLRTFEPTERSIQLCNVEAMEQATRGSWRSGQSASSPMLRPNSPSPMTRSMPTALRSSPPASGTR